jgi:uridylate kinase
MDKKVVVLKVGGSILSLSESEIFSFKQAYELKTKLYSLTDRYQFVLCIGGGYLCRKYQDMLRAESLPDIELHNAGVSTINLNAVMLRAVFGDSKNFAL